MESFPEPKTFECPMPSCLGQTADGITKCKEGYGGLLCAICADGYYLSRDTCAKCGSITLSMLILIIAAGLGLLIGAIVAFVMFRIRKKIRAALETKAKGLFDDFCSRSKLQVVDAVALKRALEQQKVDIAIVFGEALTDMTEPRIDVELFSSLCIGAEDASDVQRESRIRYTPVCLCSERIRCMHALAP